MDRYRSFLYCLFVFLVGFHIWHVSKHGLWSPPSFIDSLSLSQDCAQRYSKFDPAIRAGINGHYDGQWFYMVSYDPFILHDVYQIGYDFPRYRHNRVIYPLLTHVLAFGQPKLYPYVLFGIAILSYIVGAFVTSKLCELQGWTQWVVVGYLANTGLLYSAFRDMGEPLGVTFTLLGFLLWLSKKRKCAIASFVLAAFTKEIFIVAPMSLYLWDWWKGDRSIWKTLSAVAITIGCLLAWMAYVNYRIPHDNPFAAVPIACPSFGIGRFSLPFVALVQETIYGAFRATTRTVLKLTLSFTFITVMMIVIGILSFLRQPTLWNTLLVLQGLFLSCTRGEIWNFYASSCRQAALFHVMAIFWIADELSKLRKESPWINTQPKQGSG